MTKKKDLLQVKCGRCGRELSPDRTARREYCNNYCRKAHYRRRMGTIRGKTG